MRGDKPGIFLIHKKRLVAQSLKKRKNIFRSFSSALKGFRLNFNQTGRRPFLDGLFCPLQDPHTLAPMIRKRLNAKARLGVNYVIVETNYTPKGAA